MQPIDLDIVIPIKNESASLVQLLSAITEVLDVSSQLIRKWTVFLVDDGSNDNSGAILRNAELDARIKPLYFARSFGKESAIEAGLAQTTADWVLVMDGDLEHPPEFIPEMVRRAMESDLQIVTAIRKERPAESWHKRLSVRAFYGLFHVATGIRFSQTSDFKLVKKEVVKAYLALNERQKLFRGMTQWFGFRETLLEFEPIISSLKSGSSFSTVALLRYGVMAIVSSTSRPLLWIAWVGLALFLVTVPLALQTLWMKLSNRASEGFSTVILIQLGMSSLLMLALGVIALYLSAIYEEIKARPRYIVMDKIESAEIDLNKIDSDNVDSKKDSA